MCPTLTLARASLLLCLVVGSRQLSISKLIVPSTLQSGENVDLECDIDSGKVPAEALIVKWWFTPLNNTNENQDNIQPVQLYQRIEKGPPQAPNHTHFNILIKDHDSIALLNVSPANSGTYGCEVSYDIDEKREYAELIVYTPGGGPQLNISEVEDGPDEDSVADVLIECRADDVAPEPDISLTIDTNEINMTETIVGPDADGLYDVVGSVRVSKSIVDGTVVACELFYLDNKIAHEPYIDADYYGAPPTNATAAPEDASQPDATPDSLPKQSGDSCAWRTSWTLMFFLSLLTQATSLL